MNSDIVTLNISAEDTEEFLNNEFLQEVKSCIYSADITKDRELYLNVFTSEDQPCVQIKASALYPSEIDKLNAKFNMGIIRLITDRFYPDFKKRKVPYLRVFVYPKVKIHVERLEDTLRGNNNV